MAAKLPLVLDAAGGIQQIQSADSVPVLAGGTGATTATGARTNLGLVIGTDVLAYNALVQAIAGLGTNGIIVRTGSGSAVSRSIQGTAGRIGVTNNDATAGDPTIDLATLADGGGGSLLKFTRDAYGRVSGTSAIAAGDLTPLLDSTYVNVGGDTLTGYLTLHADPSSAMHAVTKQYADSIAAGINYKESVRAASTAAIAVSARTSTTLTIGGTTFTQDGVTLANGERFLVKDSTTGTGAGAQDNGIYVVSGVGTSVVLTRSADMDSSADYNAGNTVWVNEGTTQADTGWTVTTNGTITVGTTTVTWTQTSGLGQVVAGAGLTKTGNQLDIGTASSARIVVNADNIDLATVADSGAGSFVKITRDTYGRVTGTTAVTAGDISALLDSDITALANNATNGIWARTGTGTGAARTITGTAGRINVTNGDGVSGNPTLDLPSGVNTSGAGTYNSVTVDTYGRVTAGTTTAQGVIEDTMTNGEAAGTICGQAVYISGAGQYKKAIANAASTTDPVGILNTASVASGASGQVAVEGVVVRSTAEWDAVTGQTGGLTAGANYFLDNTTAGKITTTVPTSGYVVRIGKAISTTKLRISITQPIQL